MSEPARRNRTNPNFWFGTWLAHKRLPSPLPAGVEMQAAAVDVADDRMATVVCRSTATASGPADSDPLPWRPDVTLWDLEGHRLREFFGPDYRSGPRGDNTELVVDVLGLDANYLWWRHFDGRCRWDLSTGKPVRVPSTDDLSQSDEPAADRVLAQLYRQPGGPSESACAKAISPGGRMIAELSYNGLQVCRGQREEDPPHEFVKGQPLREVLWYYKSWCGAWEDQDYPESVGRRLCWLDDRYLLIRLADEQVMMFDVETCRAIGRLAHVDSPIFWFYRTDDTLFTSHINGEIIAWDLPAILDWCRRQGLPPSRARPAAARHHNR